MDGGLATLHSDRDSVEWLQFDLAPGGSGRHGCYPVLLAAVRDLREAAQIDDFFFMHKPPGIRVRLHPSPHARATVDEKLRGQLLDWQRKGRVRAWQAARYEPETQLFGGPVSMRSVHRLMTADSLVWLAYQAMDLARAAMALAQETTDRRIEADAHNTLGSIHHQLGHLTDARVHHQRALDLCQVTGYRYTEVEARLGLAGVLTARSQPDQAHHHAARALETSRQAGFGLLAATARSLLEQVATPV